MNKAKIDAIAEKQKKELVNEVKDWLRAYQQNALVIKEKMDELSMVRAGATSIHAQEITDMPRAQSNSKDNLTNWMVLVESMERSLRFDVEAQNMCQRAIEDSIAMLDSQKMQKIIRYRYLCGMEWSEVVREIYNKNPDYDAKQKAYTRRVYRDHERALLCMARNWGKRPNTWRKGMEKYEE